MGRSFRDAINRGNNLLPTGILTVIGLGLIPEIFGEDEVLHKVDDILMLILAAVVVAWYLMGDNRWKRSWTPLALLVVGFAIKAVAFLALEAGDQKDAGDDIAIAIVLLLTSIITAAILLRTREPRMVAGAPVAEGAPGA